MMLEDEYNDILKKAMRGTGRDAQALARATGLSASLITAWGNAQGAPDSGQAAIIARDLGLGPLSFGAAVSSHWQPEPISLPDVRHHPQQPHPSNGYVFFLAGNMRAALVDPAGIPENLLTILRDGKYHLEYILITHKHADHCDATAAISEAFPDAKIVMHDADAAAIGPLARKALRVKDGEDLPFGDDARIRMVHTPGHTDGSSAYLFASTVFTGDTLFAGSIGGAYGDVSTYDDILNSVRSKLFALPDETVVMPGHGPPSKIGWEKLHNPFFAP